MDKNFKNNFTVSYENNSTSNYLILRTGSCGRPSDYQAQMLLNNKISGLLDFNINYMGEVINCFYNITSKCTLGSFMSRKRFSRNGFLIVLLNIINNICNLRNYLLYENNVLLDESFIYVEPEKSEIYFVYLPFPGCKNDIKTFFTKLIVELANFCEEDSDNYIQKLLEAIKDELFSLSSFKALIENLLGEEIKNCSPDNGVQAVEKGRPQIERDLEGKLKNKTAQANGNIKFPELPVNEKTKKGGAGSSKKGGIDLQKQDKNKVKSGPKEGVKAISFYLCQPLLIILFIMAVKGNLVKESDNPKITFIILLLILIAVDVLIFRLVKEKWGTAEKDSAKGVLNYISDRMKNSPKPAIHEESISKNVAANADIKEKTGRPGSENTYRGETEIIKKAEIKAAPYLKEKEGDAVIELDKKSLLIGRMESFVDYVISNSAIGKIHAELSAGNGEFYVMDCNSKNGTFINDVRITPNTKSRLNNADIVRFANKEFVFCSAGGPGNNIALKEMTSAGGTV